MPYIITTKTPDTSQPTRAEAICWAQESRRAVATLEEARQAVILLPGVARSHEAYSIAEIVPEFGGTVGPLPDGTVIEVGRVEWRSIASAVGESWPQADRPRVFGRLIDAYNAQAVT